MLRDQGFAPALQALADQVGTAYRLRIDLEIDEAERLGETAQVALYTIIRELLEQAVRRGPPNADRRRDVDDGRRRRRDLRLRRRRARAAPPLVRGVEERVKQLHGTIELDLVERAHDGDGDAALVRDAALRRSSRIRADERRQRLRALRLVARRLHAARDGRRPARRSATSWDEDGLRARRSTRSASPRSPATRAPARSRSAKQLGARRLRRPRARARAPAPARSRSRPSRPRRRRHPRPRGRRAVTRPHPARAHGRRPGGRRSCA